MKKYEQVKPTFMDYMLRSNHRLDARGLLIENHDALMVEVYPKYFSPKETTSIA